MTQCIQQTQEFNCETTSKEPSSKQKKEEKLQSKSFATDHPLLNVRSGAQSC